MHRISLYKLSIIIFVSLMMMAVVFGFGAIGLTSKVNAISDSWGSFQSQHDERARLFNNLQGGLGYGGMIHYFKNYVLRKDFSHFVQLERAMGAVQSVVKQYRALSTTHAEKLVLNDIQVMLDNYQDGIVLIRTEIEKGSGSQGIDGLVKINDAFALRGLQVLREEIITKHPLYGDKSNKSVLAADLRIKLGYGGMVHAYKNYILRHDKQYREQTLMVMSDVERIIHAYYQLSPSASEKTALEDILAVLKKYKSNIKLIDQGINNHLSPEDIDQQVKVDDTYALRGMMTLDQDNIKQIEKRAAAMTVMIAEVMQAERINGATVILFTMFTAVFIFWVFTSKIIQPVKRMSQVMTQMAAGNLDVELGIDRRSKKSAKTELGSMDQSLLIFRDNEIKRRDAEIEVRRLAMTDPLTGLANRNQFDKRYLEMSALAKREQKALAYLALDLDHFKPINDEYGHLAGDLILQSVAKNLILAFRETDLIVRLGGDEFSVILYAPEGIASVEQAARRLLSLIPTPVEFGKDMLSVGVSIGIAMQEYGDEDNLTQLMSHADKALYAAKAAGRNTYRIFTSGNEEDCDSATL